ncbi:MAG: hypothetical protein M1838_005658 [Thelocarpon superellum]|nr:MAG: hypothetical protein M1838_005658 [Thelocarpon superellum]
MLFATSILLAWIGLAWGVPPSQVPLVHDVSGRNISLDLFADLEELARIVDISYCVGTTGIQKPFQCRSRCQDFIGFELVTTWNTGPLLSDSCGYVVLSHPPSSPRIILAFRGTYSITNTVVDLSTFPQEYVPYPVNDDDEESKNNPKSRPSLDPPTCTNCTVHSGFFTSWKVTRTLLLPILKDLVQKYPTYQLTLVGHSLGGAVAALAALEFHHRGWNPQITTFGEPRIGNAALAQYLDHAFSLTDLVQVEADRNGLPAMYRRVTHVNDPVPLLPLREWNYNMHAGEIYISKADLPPSPADLEHCVGDADPSCIGGTETSTSWMERFLSKSADASGDDEMAEGSESWALIPARFRLWQLFFSHRDYFWRLGLCVPGGDPFHWSRGQDGAGRASPESSGL